ncbi:MAG: PAS domain S-box protein, partial [Candidatus Omnitrophota bacterium]
QKIFLKNAKSIYISCNENYARDLKIRAEDIAGKTDYDFFPTHLAEKYRADDKRVMSSGKIENIEERFIAINDFLKDSKREVFINTVKAPIHDKDGKVVGIVGIFWDITESKEARQALLISEGKMRAVFDQASQFIGLMTVDGVLIEANKTAMNFAGIKESDCIGKYFWDTPWWTHSKDMQDKLRAAVKKVAKGETVLFEATHLDVNRRVHYVDFSLKPVRDQNGKVTFLIPEGRDVTDRKQNEEEITELHKMIEFILGATKTGLDIIDSNFNMVYIDPEWRRVYGDPTGRKCYEYFMGRSKECPGCGLRKAFETQKQVVTEEVLAREGNRPIQVTTIPFQDKRGRWLAAEVNVDITERKRIDKELEKHREHLEELVKEKTEEIKSAEAKFRLLFEDSKDCILLADVDTKKFTTFNMTACNILGYTPQEMEGISICDIHPKEELQHVLDMFEKMVAGKKNMVENVPVKKKDGSIFYADISGSAINISGKRYVMGNFRDITERKKAEEALRLSEASYRAIFDSANDAIVIRDINTFQIIDVNKKACEMFCYPRQEFIGLPMGTITADSSQGTLNKLKHFYDETAKGNPQIFEWLAKDKFGREFWVEINMKKAVVAGQYRLIYIARDITERRLNTAQKEDFINMIAHEVRAPLATIREGISLVLEGNAGPVEEKMKEVLQMTKNNIDRLNRLINTVLDLQKINIGKVELNLEEHNINETISEVCKEMMPSVEKKGLDIILELDDKLPAVKFDRDKISEVLINIINNAIKVMEKGDITIRSAFKKDHVRISVKDSGPGIKKDDIFKLFKQFSQLDKSSGGTGLGLVISKAIIDLHGGAIGVESEYGKGATFYFTLKI